MDFFQKVKNPLRELDVIEPVGFLPGHGITAAPPGQVARGEAERRLRARHGPSTGPALLRILRHHADPGNCKTFAGGGFTIDRSRDSHAANAARFSSR